jgi:hypothetical protein
LIVFILTGAAVVQRRVSGMAQAVSIKKLEEELAAAQTRVERLRSEIETAQSMARIAPLAQEKLGMLPAEETRLVILQRPPR